MSLARGFSMEPPQPVQELPDGIIVTVDDDQDHNIDPQTGAMKVEGDDGSVAIDLDPKSSAPKKSTGFDENLAELISNGELGRIGEEVLTAIESDIQSRQEWLNNRAAGIDLLGFKMESARGDTGSTTAPVEGMSTVRHPLLAEAVIRFQSNASAELLPSGGPVKVRSDMAPKPAGADDSTVPGIGDNGGPPLTDENGTPIADTIPGITNDDLAAALELDLNHYLTVTDRGYRPDVDRMLFWVGFGGCGFRKVYHDPIRRMPISRAVDAADLIVSNAANDIDDCGRITHQIPMRKSMVKRMVLAGVYRDLGEMSAPFQQANAVAEKIMEVQGFNTTPQRPEDHERTIYECYTELDIEGYEHEIDGEKTGLQLPYKISIDKDSREILEIRRNWLEDDENCLAKKVFVKYAFIPAMGFYDIGLLNLLGNADRALTGAWRLMLDSGMFANFPGFLYAEMAGRQVSNEFRVAPGAGQKVQTGGRAIGDVVMRLPYNDVTPGLATLVQSIQDTSQRVGGTAELQIGEGRQDAPVGTTLAMIEQATKMLAAVHIRLHAAQSEEFQLLKARFREDPAALWRHNRRPARKWEVDEFIAALDSCDLVPAADPNTASQLQRIMKAVAVKQLQAATPWLYDAKAVDTRILRSIGIQEPETLFAPNASPPQPGPPPVDQTKVAAIQVKAQTAQAEAQARMAELQQQGQQNQAENQTRAQEALVESADRAADRASREKVAQSRVEAERLRSVGDLARDGVITPQQAEQEVLQSPSAPPPGTPMGNVPGPVPGGGLGAPPVGWTRPI